MKTKIKIDDLEIEVGYEIIARFADSLKDTKENTDLFDKLSQHPSSEVRYEIAYKENLNESTVNRLISDKEIDVVRRIISNDISHNYVDFETLKELILKDKECACAIANRIEDWNGKGKFDYDSKDIAEIIVNHPDPAVRYALADSYSAPKAALKMLLKDIDPYVAACARQSLNND